MNPTNFNVKIERGTAREEYYRPGHKEPFGLHKRTRRQKRGILCTLPDGKLPKN